ncbi:MAG: hypothetical protein QXI12_13495 [Candidatus Methanomethyliaceae archaeon]
MLIMTKQAYNTTYQTLKQQLMQIANGCLQTTPIQDLSTFLNQVQTQLTTTAGITMSHADILKHLKEGQGKSIDGSNCTQQTINGQIVMVPNDKNEIVIV